MIGYIPIINRIKEEPDESDTKAITRTDMTELVITQIQTILS